MRERTWSWSWLWLLVLTAGCPGGDDDAQVPVLTPEPAGAPVAIADGRLSCIGNNRPANVDGDTVQLVGWVRSFADPANLTGAPPTSGEIEAFDENGDSLGTALANWQSGRTALTVPSAATGFVGTVKVAAPGFVSQLFASSRPVTNSDAAGWSWLTTDAELDAVATAAGVALDPTKAILVGAVHDCDVFGTANVVIRVAGTTAGVVYFDAFAPVPALTYTAASGRFAVPNLTPGPVIVEAFARAEAGGPLELFSRVDVTVAAGVVTAVDLQPRMGAER